MYCYYYKYFLFLVSAQEDPVEDEIVTEGEDSKVESDDEREATEETVAAGKVRLQFLFIAIVYLPLCILFLLTL